MHKHGWAATWRSALMDHTMHRTVREGLQVWRRRFPSAGQALGTSLRAGFWLRILVFPRCSRDVKISPRCARDGHQLTSSTKHPAQALGPDVRIGNRVYARVCFNTRNLAMERWPQSLLNFLFQHNLADSPTSKLSQAAPLHQSSAAEAKSTQGTWAPKNRSLAGHVRQRWPFLGSTP
jgi:hypothetical protein